MSNGVNIYVRRIEEEKAKKKRVPPSSYDTMPRYFPAEQVGVVKKKKKIDKMRRVREKRAIIFVCVVRGKDCVSSMVD